MADNPFADFHESWHERIEREQQLDRQARAQKWTAIWTWLLAIALIAIACGVGGVSGSFLINDERSTAFARLLGGLAGGFIGGALGFYYALRWWLRHENGD